MPKKSFIFIKKAMVNQIQNGIMSINNLIKQYEKKKKIILYKELVKDILI